ncbi:S-layer homology domain-containing protein [Rossellomorea vietnamensis]|uniref:S-layer homology domain-containing protein n=1 Tax=Rossellomorea vietnamensis TaxID=218284 RepID=A0A5D4MBT7_9BACI|nr:S-layer homology domain-containing protein [Rossellomorea vietnamensis]TYR98958.1 S-layer homology domain-containing protein [Rossellomorea vietnamensis]
MKKIILLFFVAFSLILSFGMTVSASGKFKDINRYVEEIEFLARSGVVKGYGDEFKPEDPVRRIQAVQMILREKGITDFSDVSDPGFTDLRKGDYGYAEVAKAAEIGWISGKTAADGSTYFDTWGSLTRGQMAKILVKAYELSGEIPNRFKDVPQSHWAHEFVSTLIHHRITTGYQNQTYRPQETLSRQHFAVFLARLAENNFRYTDIPITSQDEKVYFSGVTIGTSVSQVTKQLGTPQAIELNQMTPGDIYIYRPSPFFKDTLNVFIDPDGEVEFINYRTYTSFPQSIEDKFVKEFNGEIFGEMPESEPHALWLHYYFPQKRDYVFMTDSDQREGTYLNRFKLGPEYQGVPIESDDYFKEITKEEAIAEYSKY